MNSVNANKAPAECDAPSEVKAKPVYLVNGATTRNRAIAHILAMISSMLHCSFFSKYHETILVGMGAWYPQFKTNRVYHVSVHVVLDDSYVYSGNWRRIERVADFLKALNKEILGDPSYCACSLNPTFHNPWMYTLYMDIPILDGDGDTGDSRGSPDSPGSPDEDCSYVVEWLKKNHNFFFEEQSIIPEAPLVRVAGIRLVFPKVEPSLVENPHART